jgi:16S rRNA C1402 N4-methylase RsmH
VLASKVVEGRSKKLGLIKTTGDFKLVIREGFPSSAKDEKNNMIKRAF